MLYSTAARRPILSRYHREVAHPFNLQGVAMAAGDQGSAWEDYGMRWDNSGKTAHYAPINWSDA